MALTVDTFAREMAEALESFDKYIVCVNKTPDQCEASLKSLLKKAIDAYGKRAPGLRHGIALDRQVTVILSQRDDDEVPYCAIYFNLSSPYHKKPPAARTRSAN